MIKHFDLGSILVIIITFIFFVTALFTKGFTHDLLLEIAVFLVSVKLIIMSYKNSISVQAISDELKEIKELIKKKIN